MAQINLITNRFSKINASRAPDFSGDVTTKTNIKILNLEENTKETFKVKYLFEIDYSDLGKISLEGILFLSSDPKTIKELQKSWKDKKIQNENYIFITNLVLQKSSLKALELEEELNLPFHIKLPKVDLKQN